MNIKYSAIKYFDIANGAGVRTSLFVSGCRKHCKGCFNEEAWSFDSGSPFDDNAKRKVLDSLKYDYVDGLSILGGEPLDRYNAEEVWKFIADVRIRYKYTKDIWVYTGYTWEEIQSHLVGPYAESIIADIDVLVDGPFVEELKDLTLRFRGSSNQRIINCNESNSNKIVLWDDGPVFSTHKSYE